MESETRQHIGVCLSGGGHRASLFGLGALMYLIDAGKGPEIATVSSVSGGSLTNAWLGLHCDLTTVEPKEFSRQASTLAKRIALKGTLWASPLTYLYLAVLVAPLVLAVVLTFTTGGVAAAEAWIGGVVLTAILAGARSWVARRSFESALFHGRGLSELHQEVDHVLCATDYQTSEAVYFSGGFVGSWRTGFGGPGNLRLASAAQASAALPGAFPPVSISTARFNLATPAVLRRFLLSDGGVYDNMGTEWVLRSRRSARASGRGSKPVDEVVVINSSAAQGVVGRGRLQVPLLGEVLALLAAKDVLYDQTTSVRRRWLFTRSQVAWKAPGLNDIALRSAVMQIDRTPIAVPEEFARGKDDVAQRAQAVLAVLGSDRPEWKADAQANRSVGTKLSKIPAERAARLLRHAYVLTMANTHVLLGYPLLEVPSLDIARGWLS